jgi:hypothetical protein
MVKQTITPLKNQTRQTHLSRLYFLSKGCTKCPIEITIKTLWANPYEGYFMSDLGSKIKLNFSPARQRKNVKGKTGVNRGLTHPILRHYGGKSAHRIMFATFANEPCPIFFDSKGNPYKGIVHHVIENPYDIRMDNLLGWLTYREHKIADKRRRALEAVLPDMYCVETKYLKLLQDPRKTDDIFFEMELNKLRMTYGTKDN